MAGRPAGTSPSSHGAREERGKAGRHVAIIAWSEGGKRKGQKQASFVNHQDLYILGWALDWASL